jgi:hypothetical protein
MLDSFDVQSTIATLADFKGSVASVCFFKNTHGTLVIQLEKSLPDRNARLFLVCFGCIALPVINICQDVDFALVQFEGALFILHDKNSIFAVTLSSILVMHESRLRQWFSLKYLPSLQSASANGASSSSVGASSLRRTQRLKNAGLLRDYCKATVRVIYYGINNSQLILSLQKQSKFDTIYLSCQGCELMQTRLTWTNSDLRFAQSQCHLLAYDVFASVNILCENATVGTEYEVLKTMPFSTDDTVPQSEDEHGF